MDEIILEKRQGNSTLKSNLSLNTKKLYWELPKDRIAICAP